ncbi:LysR family transcriptional regulator [Nesterenkonia rhizosphaerae]|uniref:LysR family transcriptional regulator n=1 Tax=Nesterenkonia rhizosphaerae TaxID=1348272 RepID=A0ABP9FRM9_9MICC
MLTLDQVRSFVAVAEELHFGRAAERLNMTQPPLSRQIQKLERTVGVQLLERDNRKVSLTTAGRAFLEDARKLLVSAEQAPLMARRIARGQAGVLRIGFTAASGFSVLGQLLSLLAEELPDVEIDLREEVTRGQIAALQSGELDMGLARPPIQRDLFDSHLLRSESLLLAVPHGHPLTQRQDPIPPSELKDVPLIMYSPTKARYFYDLLVRLIPIHHTNIVHQVSQILTMISLVAAGRGLAVVPESAASLGISGVSYLPLEKPAQDVVELHAIWRREHRNPALTQLLSVLEERGPNWVSDSHATGT